MNRRGTSALRMRVLAPAARPSVAGHASAAAGDTVATARSEGLRHY